MTTEDDHPRVHVVAGDGDGLVFVKPGVVCVIHEPAAAPADTQRLLALLEHLEGDALAEALRTCVADRGAGGPPIPALAVMIGTLDDARILLHGDTGFTAELDGGESRGSGGSTGSVVDRDITGPVRLLGIGGEVDRPPEAGWWNLRWGTAPGTSAWLMSGPRAAAAVASVADAVPAEEGQADAVPAEEGEEVIVRGVRCPEDHHNNPRASYCSLCGLRMGVSRSLVLVDGPRPPLGVLIVDDGATIPVRGDMVLGRTPDGHPLVREGAARGAVIADAGRSISRAHLHVRLDDWDVFVSDLGSSNGTFLLDEATNTWRHLIPGTEERLDGRTRLHLGQREVIFAPHHVAS